MSQDELWDLFPDYWDGDVGLFGWLARRLHLHGPGPLGPTYFLFVEEVAAVSFAEGIDAPNGAPLQPPDARFEGPQTRFRASGVAAERFMKVKKTFTEVLSRDASPEARSRRRQQLSTYFEERPVRRFDIYVGDSDEERRAIAATLLPTSWTMITLGPDRPPAGARRVFHSLDEPDAGPTYEKGRLRLIAPVSPPLELRLRDIFSLNHIGDTDLRGRGGETPPPGPGGGGGKGSVDLTGSKDKNLQAPGAAAPA